MRKKHKNGIITLILTLSLIISTASSALANESNQVKELITNSSGDTNK